MNPVLRAVSATAVAAGALVIAAMPASAAPAVGTITDLVGAATQADVGGVVEQSAGNLNGFLAGVGNAVGEVTSGDVSGAVDSALGSLGL